MTRFWSTVCALQPNSRNICAKEGCHSNQRWNVEIPTTGMSVGYTELDLRFGRNFMAKSRALVKRATREEVEEKYMELSARNQLPGTVKEIHLGGVMAEVTVELTGGQTVVSAITRSSVERLNLQVGDAVTVIIKSTEVILGK